MDVKTQWVVYVSRPGNAWRSVMQARKAYATGYFHGLTDPLPHGHYALVQFSWSKEDGSDMVMRLDAEIRAASVPTPPPTSNRAPSRRKWDLACLAFEAGAPCDRRLTNEYKATQNELLEWLTNPGE